MKILVTGSAGHLGEALMRHLPAAGHEVIGLDVAPSPYTHIEGSIVERAVARQAVAGVDAVLHTATLHKPHVESHGRQDFIDTNLTGTLNLLEEAAAAGVGAFVLTSTTSTFGRALTPPAGAPAVWVTEHLVPQPKNIYGVTKRAAEELCELVHGDHGLPCIVLRTSRFFAEPDDRHDVRDDYDDGNVKVNELLNRRVDLEDVAVAHELALEGATRIGFGRYIISATTPFAPSDVVELRTDAPAVVRRLVPECDAVYAARGWSLFPTIDRVYVNDAARADLGWKPRYDFRFAIERLAAGLEPRSELAVAVGTKGYRGAASYP